MPARINSAQRPLSQPPTSATTSPYLGSFCMVAGTPLMCITTTPQPVSRATATISGSAVRPLTSLTTTAPSAKAALATSAFIVSIEIKQSGQASRKPRTTGKTRRISSSNGTSSAPGRVD